LRSKWSVSFFSLYKGTAYLSPTTLSGVRRYDHHHSIWPQNPHTPQPCQNSLHSFSIRRSKLISSLLRQLDLSPGLTFKSSGALSVSRYITVPLAFLETRWKILLLTYARARLGSAWASSRLHSRQGAERTAPYGACYAKGAERYFRRGRNIILSRQACDG
jgi:hypothetical protein